MIFIWPKALINTSCDLLKPFSKHWQEVIKTARRLLRAERRGERVLTRETLLMLLRRVISRSGTSAALLFQTVVAVYSWIIHDAREKKMSLESQINSTGGLKVIWERNKDSWNGRRQNHLFLSFDEHHCCCWLFFFLFFLVDSFFYVKKWTMCTQKNPAEAEENEHFICETCAFANII